MKHLKTFENFSNTEINEEISLKDIGQALKSFAQKIGVLKTDEQKRKAALDFIKGHRVYNEAYEKMLKEDPEKAEKYVQFRIDNPDKKYIKWDDVKKEFLKICRVDPEGELILKERPRVNEETWD